MIPLDQLVPEVMLALGGALLLGNLAAYWRLRPAWREQRRGAGAKGRGPAGAAGTAPPPPRARVLVNIAIGLAVTAAAGATLLRHH